MTIYSSGDGNQSEEVDGGRHYQRRARRRNRTAHSSKTANKSTSGVRLVKMPSSSSSRSSSFSSTNEAKSYDEASQVEGVVVPERSEDDGANFCIELNVALVGDAQDFVSLDGAVVSLDGAVDEIPQLHQTHQTHSLASFVAYTSNGPRCQNSSLDAENGSDTHGEVKHREARPDRAQRTERGIQEPSWVSAQNDQRNQSLLEEIAFKIPFPADGPSSYESESRPLTINDEDFYGSDQ